MDKWGKLNTEEWGSDEESIEEDISDSKDEREEGGWETDDSFINDEQVFQDDIKAFERVGFGKLGTNIEGPIGDKIRRLEQINQDPKERFIRKVQAIALEIKNNYNKLSDQDINYIEEKISLVNKPEHKNPLGFVLGYIGSKGGIIIDKENIEEAFLTLKKLSDNTVTEPDVIRYSKYWIILNRF